MLNRDKNPILLQFAVKVRQRRRSLRLTQEQLAVKVDFHVNYVGGIERGERNLSLLSLISLTKALECKLADLLPEELISN